MYRNKGGKRTNDNLSISKSVRLDPDHIKIIETESGRTFSKKLKNVLSEYKKMKDI